MSLNPPNPLLYLITSGKTSLQTTPATKDFSNVLQLIQAAVAARIDLVQIREKNLSASMLYQLTASAARITKGSATKLLVNDRSDIAAAAGADGVHLTTSSLPADVVRQTFGGSSPTVREGVQDSVNLRTFGDEFLIGVSTHSLDEARIAREGGADFIVFGPVFETAAKSEYGEPVGITNLARVCAELSPFPVLALGGLTIANVANCIHAGAAGIAAISLLNDPQLLVKIADQIREIFAT